MALCIFGTMICSRLLIYCIILALIECSPFAHFVYGIKEKATVHNLGLTVERMGRQHFVRGLTFVSIASTSSKIAMLILNGGEPV